MSRPLPLRKNFAWALFGNVISAICSWVLLMVLAKSASVRVLGVFAVGQAFCLPISRLFGLQLTIVQTTDVCGEYRFGHYYALKIITSTLAVAVSILVGSVLYSGESFNIIVLLSVGYWVMTVRDVFLGCLRKHERMDKVALSHTLLGVSSAVLFSIIFLASRSLFLSVVVMIIARLAVVYFHDMPITGSFLGLSIPDGQPASMKLLWSRHMLWDLTKTSLPLGLVALFQTLYVSAPKLVLDKYFGKKDVGYFAAMSSLLVVGMMVIAALSHSVTPRLAKYYSENLRAYKTLLGKLLGISIVLGISGIVLSSLFGKLILTLIFKSDYAEHNDVFIWITVAGAISFIFNFMNSGLNAARRFKIQMQIHGFTAALCVLFSLLLIPHYGMTGAAWAVIICYGFGLLGSTFFVVVAVKEKGFQEAIKDFSNVAD